jgi:intein-encoded DNA endonuclease-like protein
MRLLVPYFFCKRTKRRNDVMNTDVQNNAEIRKNRLSRNSNYFESIDSMDKAYWLGVMYSDGCVCERKNGLYSISLEMTDKEHIEKFRDALSAVDHKILTVLQKNSNNAKLSYAIHIYDKKMGQDLIKLGCVPKKSFYLSSVPNIPKEFIYDFIRGFTDGDGCICYNKSSCSYVFKLTGASPLLLKDIMKLLEIDRLSLNQCTKTSYQVTSGKRDDIYRILTKLYEHSTETTRLDRKYNKYQEFIQWYKQKINQKGARKQYASLF